MTDYEYDVCLSFAGEQRQYVEEVARLLTEAGVSIFYDGDNQIALWGKNLNEFLDEVYRKKSRFCVMFVSVEYRDKMWTRYERRSAFARAMREDEDYLLPARFDESEIPGLLPSISYIDLRNQSPAVFAHAILTKIRPSADGSDPAPSEIGVPQSLDDEQQLLVSRPPGWEYLLFAGVLSQGIEALRPKWRDHRMGYAPKTAQLAQPAEILDYSKTAIERAHAIGLGIEGIFNPEVQTEAFGLPGEPGSAEAIRQVVERFLKRYEDLLDWSASVRSLNVPIDFQPALEALAQLVTRPLREIQDFVAGTEEQIGRLPSLIEQGEPIAIELTCSISIDGDVMQRYYELMEKALNQT